MVRATGWMVAAGLVVACGPRDFEDLATASLAQIDGEIVVEGLQMPVEIRRDPWGVAHIYAQTVEDLFYAQGYAAAQDRLWQLEVWRRVGEGRLSEIVGPETFERVLDGRESPARLGLDSRVSTAPQLSGQEQQSAVADSLGER